MSNLPSSFLSPSAHSELYAAPGQLSPELAQMAEHQRQAHMQTPESESSASGAAGGTLRWFAGKAVPTLAKLGAIGVAATVAVLVLFAIAGAVGVAVLLASIGVALLTGLALTLLAYRLWTHESTQAAPQSVYAPWRR